MNYEKIIKYGFWIVAIIVVINLFMSNGDEVDIGLDIDFDLIADHEIYETVQSDRDDMVLYNYAVVITEPAESREIEETIRMLVQEAIYEKEFSALVFEVYDHEKYVEREGYTLARAVYAPEGELSLAVEIEPGQHRQLDFDWDILKKDWERQPEDEDVEIWAFWHDEQQVNGLAEEEAFAAALEKFELEEEELEDILQEQQRWMLMDIQ